MAENSVGTLFDAAVRLAYNTDNVTLSGEATFTYDGELFKTMHASYKQDGINSYLSYMLDTPKDDGRVYTGGYSVVGLGSDVYANDTYWGNYYYTGNQVISDSILTSNRQVLAMLSLARTLAVTAESLGLHTVDVNEDGTEYNFKVNELPSYINDTAFYLVLDYINEHYYRNMWNTPDVLSVNTPIYYCDWEGFVRSLYERLYNVPAPEDFYADGEQERMTVVFTWADQISAELSRQYEGGSVLINTDGTHEWFANESDCARAAGILDVSFKNLYASLSSYYTELTGLELTQDMFNVLVYSPNAELWNAYYNFYQQTEEHYKQLALEQDPLALKAVVREDGTIVTENVLSKGYYSVTEQILGTMASAGLKSLDAKVTVDSEGRLTGFIGQCELSMTDIYSVDHVIGITFDLTASDYGTTYVNPAFDPAEYGWVSYAEYIENVNSDTAGTEEPGYILDWEEFVNNAPDTIDFLGNTYDTGMSVYKD